MRKLARRDAAVRGATAVPDVVTAADVAGPGATSAATTVREDRARVVRIRIVDPVAEVGHAVVAIGGVDDSLNGI